MQHYCLYFYRFGVDLTDIFSSITVFDAMYEQIPVICKRSFYTDPIIIDYS